jgi:hypothetical protein
MATSPRRLTYEVHHARCDEGNRGAGRQTVANVQYPQRPFSVFPQRVHPYEHYICSSQCPVDVATKPRLLQFAGTSDMDPTTATTITEPTQLSINVSISAPQTTIITRQLGVVKYQLQGVQTSRIRTLCDRSAPSPLSAIYAN